MSDLPKIGIDIGSSAIKLVELVPAGKQWRLVSAASAPVGTTLAAIIKEAGMRSKRAVVALPEEQVSSHVVELPMMKDDEIEQALEWQVEQYIPIPKDEAVWSWEVVRRGEAGSGS
ncbi:MAG: type IV pilus assembly protein PilM, partial [Candidatus Amesbacteria bacterium GW2011_GWC2_47_8]